eukprot:SM000047S16846  [mRNA]  locus=s47:198882:199424:- [translate_table: standard]
MAPGAPGRASWGSCVVHTYKVAGAGQRRQQGVVCADLCGFRVSGFGLSVVGGGCLGLGGEHVGVEAALQRLVLALQLPHVQPIAPRPAEVN